MADLDQYDDFMRYRGFSEQEATSHNHIFGGGLRQMIDDYKRLKRRQHREGGADENPR